MTLLGSEHFWCIPCARLGALPKCGQDDYWLQLFVLLNIREMAVPAPDLASFFAVARQNRCLPSRTIRRVASHSPKSC
jgi:hypothetical protein